MRVKAAAYHEYNQAAVLDKVITNLPEVVKAIAEPLSKVDKISILSTGGPNGSNLGASRVTGDVVTMLAQIPALLEALTGTRMSDLMARVPGLTVDGTTAEPSDGVRPEDAEKPAEPTTEPVPPVSVASNNANSNASKNTKPPTPGTK